MISCLQNPVFLFRFGWGGAIIHRGLPGCSPRLDVDLPSRILNSGTRRSASGPGRFTSQVKEEDAKPASGTVRKNVSFPKGIELKYFGRQGCSRDTTPTEISQQSLTGYGKYETKRQHRGLWADGRVLLKSIVRIRCVSQWMGLVWLRTGSSPCNDNKIGDVRLR